MATEEFEAYVVAQARQALRAIPESMLQDVYVISFFMYDYEDDPRFPTLTVGCNTKQRWRECTPAAGQAPKWPIASDSDEAKWNYAFWLHNELAVVGKPGTESAELRKRWLKEQGLWFDGELFDSDQEEAVKISAQITDAFVQLCIRTAQSLHAEGFIAKVFNHPLPIVIHELEYYDQIADQTARANPDRLADEFVSWVRRM